MPFETETRGDSDSEEAFPFTAVKAGANGSPALSLSTYGDCVLRTGRCRTANILVFGVDDGLCLCIYGVVLAHLVAVGMHLTTRTTWLCCSKCRS